MESPAQQTQPAEPRVLQTLGMGPCVRLPVEIDATRFADEIAALPESVWSDPTRNPAVQGDVDAFFAYGSRRGIADRNLGPHPVFDRLPALRKFVHDEMPGQVIRVVGARLSAGGFVPLHTDSPEFYRGTLRIVIPLTTNPGALLYCDGASFQMPVGEVWTFDNQLRHAAWNDGDTPRIHILADFVPDDRMRDLVRAGQEMDGTDDGDTSARIEEMSRKRYAERRWRHLRFRILERLHLR